MRIPRVPSTSRGLVLAAAFTLAGQLPAQEKQPAAPSPPGVDSKASSTKAPSSTAPLGQAPDAAKAAQPAAKAAQPAVQGAQPAAQGAPRALNGQPSVEVKRTSDPQAIAIVDNYLKALGGKDVLSKMKDRATKFRNIKHSATGETVAEINLLLKDGIYFREEWEIKGFDIKGEPLAFIQIYNGEEQEGWVHMMGTVSSLDGRTLQVFVYDKYMDDFFAHWEEDGYVLTLAGQGLVSKEQYGEEHPCDIVLVSDFSGRQAHRFFFSKTNGLLVKKEWQDAGQNPKQPVNREQFFKRYVDLPFMDGSGLQVKFALRHEVYMDGDLDTERVYTSVVFNSNLSPKLFEKPAGVPFDRAVTGGEKASSPQGGPKKDEPQGIHGSRGKGALTPVGPKTSPAPGDSKSPPPAGSPTGSTPPSGTPPSASGSGSSPPPATK